MLHCFHFYSSFILFIKPEVFMLFTFTFSLFISCIIVNIPLSLSAYFAFTFIIPLLPFIFIILKELFPSSNCPRKAKNPSSIALLMLLLLSCFLAHISKLIYLLFSCKVGIKGFIIYLERSVFFLLFPVTTIKIEFINVL